MLGHSHALSGLAAGAATLPWAPVHGTVAQMSWIAAAGGFAMLATNDDALCVDGVCAVPESAAAQDDPEEDPER